MQYDLLYRPALAMLAAYGCALVAGPLLRRRASAIATACCAVPLVFLSPLLIPASQVLGRSAAALVSIDIALKIVDFARQTRFPARASAGRPRTLVEYCAFLVPFPLLLVVFGNRERRPLRAGQTLRECFRFLGGSAAFAGLYALLVALAENPTLQSSFALDHATKTVMFLLAVESGSIAVSGLERLAGFRVKPVIDAAYRSRTVGEFWRRFNSRVHVWLHANVFRPSGGMRAPVRGVFLACLVSAVFHEVLFGFATSRFDGYQFGFFLLQAPAVLASARLERLTRRAGVAGAVVARAVTIAWLAVTSMLFFHGVDRVFPEFYASEPWLP